MSEYFQNQLFTKTRGNTVPKILKPDRLESIVLLPPIEEQIEIEKMRKTIESKSNLINLKK
jgi:restriction endonuclease S subunit